MMHLGSLSSALADGQLDAAATERALAHVACCRRCREALAEVRAARRAVTTAQDAPPGPELTARLLALAATAEVVSSADVAQWPLVPTDSHSPHGGRFPRHHRFPAGWMTGDVTRRSALGSRVALGSLAAAGIAAAVLFVLGGAPSVAPIGHPAQALTLLAQSGSGRDLGGAHSVFASVGEGSARTQRPSDSALPPEVDGQSLLAWLGANGWSSPSRLPDGATVTAVRLTGAGEGLLEVDLETPSGQVVLTEQRGRLDAGAMGRAEQHTVGEAQTYVLSRAPWHLVWQSNDDVVQVVSDAPVEQVEQVVRDFPADGYDDAAPARILRGWRTLTGVMARP
jgi:hypothetical protein